LASALHVVFVDDDDLMVRVMETALQEARTDPPIGRIVTALDPDAAVELVRAAPEGPLLVISDFNLKAAKNGIDVLRAAADLRPDSVRILFSGYAADQIGDVTAGGAIHAFIEKPLRMSEIHAPLAGIVRRGFARSATN
jgi:DNA-binding NtrC family response regulator